MTAVEKKLPTPLARGRRNYETRRFGSAQDQAGPIRGYLDVM